MHEAVVIVQVRVGEEKRREEEEEDDGGQDIYMRGPTG